MPLYEYVCKKCGKRSERIEKMNGPRMRKCPKCGGTVEQVLSAPAIQFKGSGWYVTDYAGKSGKTEPVKTEGAETGKADAKEKKETKSDGGAAEKSGEKSTDKKAKSTAKEK